MGAPSTHLWQTCQVINQLYQLVRRVPGTASILLLISLMKHRKPLITALFATLLALPMVPLVHTMVPLIRDRSLREKVASIVDREAQKLNPGDRQEIASAVSNLANSYGMSPLLILAVIKVESNFNIKAVSNKDARGLMQVRPIVVREVANDLGINPHDGQSLFGHEFNLRVGVHYLAGLLKQFHGDIKKALMAYNAGPTTIARIYKNRPVPEGGYQGKVLKVYRGLSNS